MRGCVTGGAGFTGSTLVDRLLADGHAVVAFDNVSTGQERFLASALPHPTFMLTSGDTLDLAALTEAMRGADVVFHQAASADMRFATEHPRKDLILRIEPSAELIWASPRELLNIFQADAIGCQIITVTHDILTKLTLVGKDLDECSLDTVKTFYDDARAAGDSLQSLPTS